MANPYAFDFNRGTTQLDLVNDGNRPVLSNLIWDTENPICSGRLYGMGSGGGGVITVNQFKSVFGRPTIIIDAAQTPSPNNMQSTFGIFGMVIDTTI